MNYIFIVDNYIYIFIVYTKLFI